MIAKGYAKLMTGPLVRAQQVVDRQAVEEIMAVREGRKQASDHSGKAHQEQLMLGLNINDFLCPDYGWATRGGWGTASRTWLRKQGHR